MWKGLEPGPAAVVTVPTREEAGQLGFARSVAALLCSAAAISPSGHRATPVREATRPRGAFATSELSSRSPSRRMSSRMKGLGRPATRAPGPALNVGEKERVAGLLGQPLPPGPEARSKPAVGWELGTC